MLIKVEREFQSDDDSETQQIFTFFGIYYQNIYNSNL
jgi:hypothetical protein